MNKDSLWNEYCKLLDMDFKKRLEYYEEKLNTHLSKWKDSKTARRICKGEFRKLEDVSPTTYDDYPVLLEFGEKMDKLYTTRKKAKGVSWLEHIRELEREPSMILDGWLPGKYYGCARTSGTSGKSKWTAFTKEFLENFNHDSVMTAILTSSYEWGSTKLKKGDVTLNMGIPVPYIGGYSCRATNELFEHFPTIEVTDDMPNMRDKIRYILKGLKNGQRLDVAGGMGATFYMFAKALTAPDEFYRDNYESMNFALGKIILYFLWQKAKREKKEGVKAKDVLPVKGLGTGGLDALIYADFLKEEFGCEPLNVYGSTEFGVIMHGMPDKKMALMPNFNATYMEFIDENGEIRKVDEVKVGKVYEIIGTPFGSPFIRYRLGDLVKVCEKRDDGTPIFSFESRKSNVLDIHNYFRITESVAFQMIAKAGLRNSERWAITKITPKDKLLVLMEKDWEYSEKEAEKRIFDALFELCEYFRDYVRDFNIKEPHSVIEVKYLKKGAFMRYTNRMMQSGASVGQYKSPKIIPPNRNDIIEILTK
jgi:hypothetical protein